MNHTKYSRRAFRTFSRSQRGLGVIDVLLGLLLAALLGLGLYKAFGQGSNSGKINDENQALVQAAGTIQARCKAAGSYGASGYDLSACIVKADQVPAGWTANGTTLTNNFGGLVTPKSTVTGFSLTTAGLPDSVCHDVAVSNSLKGSSVSINSGSTSSTAVTDAVATAGCTAGTSNSITFTFPY